MDRLIATKITHAIDFIDIYFFTKMQRDFIEYNNVDVLCF